MIPCTITYGQLRVDRDGSGNLTIARTDRPESVQLSRTEWAFVLKCAEIFGMPVCPGPSEANYKST
jgi:hypothetical protein